jgi:hypothetical protein
LPTYAWLARFRSDFEQLTPAQQTTFLAAVRQFIDDLQAGSGFWNGLRVKGVRGATGIFEMTWAPDGRATFQYGAEVTPGQVHIVWRRVGTHTVFEKP